MKNNFLYENFINAIEDRIPQKKRFAESLSDLLCIEKEAIYRRLRGEVPFTFSEITRIAIKLGISLDSIAEGSSPISRPLSMKLMNFFNLDEEDYAMMDGFANGLRSTVNDPNAEYGAISSIIPTSLSISYKNIYKFYLLKWLQQFEEGKDLRSFSKISPSERLLESNDFFVECLQRTANSVYIFDEQFIEYLVNDIQFFQAIRLVTHQEVALIKEDLQLFINDLERYAKTGKFDLGGKVNVYLSKVHFEANYSYINAKDYKLTMIRAFTLCDAYSFDEQVFENMKRWTRFLKQTSTLLFESDEIQHHAFFTKQQEIINQL